MVPVYKIIQVYEYMYQRTYMQPGYVARYDTPSTKDERYPCSTSLPGELPFLSRERRNEPWVHPRDMTRNARSNEVSRPIFPRTIHVLPWISFFPDGLNFVLAVLYLF